MNYNIIKVDNNNYNLFDDMIYYRVNGKERTDDEKKYNEVNIRVPDEINDENLHVFVIETDNKFVAWISLVFLPKVGKKNRKGYIFVDELWVSLSYRGLGLSKELMKKADDLCILKEAAGIRLFVNTENPVALNLYENMGYNNNSKAFFMEKL